MTATNYLEAKILDHVLGVAAYSIPTSLYLALHTADPTETGLVAEVAGGGYAPQLITFGAAVGPAMRANSTNAQTFLSMPALTITHFSIKENSAGGNPVLYGNLTINRTPVAGDPVFFGTGQIAITCD